MFLVRTFIFFALGIAASTGVSAIGGVEVLERYSKDLMTPYHGTLEQQVRQEQNKKAKAEAAITLITTGTLPIGPKSLPKTLPAKELGNVQPFNRPPYICYKHFGFSEIPADYSVKTLYMELMMAAFWLEVPVKSLINNAMLSPKLAHLCGPGRHLSLLNNFWDILENWGSSSDKKSPLPYFEDDLDPQRTGKGRYDCAFLSFWRKVKEAFPRAKRQLKEEKEKEEQIERESKESQQREMLRRFKEVHRGIKKFSVRSLTLPFIQAFDSEKTRQSLQDFLTEFAEHDIEVIRNGVRYQVVPCQIHDPTLGVYRTPPLAIGKPLESNIGYLQHYGGLRDGVDIYIANYLKDHRKDPNFRWPDFMQLQTTAGEMVPLLMRPTPTSIRFSSPAPFLVYQSLPVSPTPPVISRGMELFPSSVYEILSFITGGIASIYPPTSVLTLRITNGSHQLSVKEGKEVDMEKVIEPLGLTGRVDISEPFLGPKGTVFAFVRNQKAKNSAASYLLECDVKKKALAKTINCTDVIDLFPTYVLIPTHGYLCVAAQKTFSGNNLLFFDLIKGQQLTKICFKNEQITEKGHNLTVNLGELDIDDIE